MAHICDLFPPTRQRSRSCTSVRAKCFAHCATKSFASLGLCVDSTVSTAEGLSLFWSSQYDLVLIDVEGEHKVADAEGMCSEIKTAQPEQMVAFVCNWRVAMMTDCPDEILRTEFDPQRFVNGVRGMLHAS